MDKTSPQSRLTALDLLRAIAILLVLGRHILVVPASLPDGVQMFFGIWRRFGWTGVDLFFVLSGFLVSGLLFQEYRLRGDVSVSRFLIRRGFKIYPSFYVFLAMSVLMIYVMNPSQLKWKPFLGELFFLQNYLDSLWNHTWSLAVEEHFYIGLALAAWLWMRIGKMSLPSRMVPVGIALCLAGLLIARAAAIYEFSFRWSQVHSFTHWRIDSLLFGVLLSYFFHFYRDGFDRLCRRWAGLLLGLSVLLLLPMAFVDLETNRFVASFGFTFLYLGFGGLIALSLATPPRWLSGKTGWASFFAGIGRRSYGMYLVHMPVYVLVVLGSRRVWGHDVFAFEVAAYVIGTALIGFGLSYAIEQPMLRVRDRHFPSKKS